MCICGVICSELLEYVVFMFILCVIWNSQAAMTFSTALMVPNITCSIAIKKLRRFVGGGGDDDNYREIWNRIKEWPCVEERKVRGRRKSIKSASDVSRIYHPASFVDL